MVLLRSARSCPASRRCSVPIACRAYGRYALPFRCGRYRPAVPCSHSFARAHRACLPFAPFAALPGSASLRASCHGSALVGSVPSPALRRSARSILHAALFIPPLCGSPRLRRSHCSCAASRSSRRLALRPAGCGGSSSPLLGQLQPRSYGQCHHRRCGVPHVQSFMLRCSCLCCAARRPSGDRTAVALRPAAVPSTVIHGHISHWAHHLRRPLEPAARTLGPFKGRGQNPPPAAAAGPLSGPTAPVYLISGGRRMLGLSPGGKRVGGRGFRKERLPPSP